MVAVPVGFTGCSSFNATGTGWPDSYTHTHSTHDYWSYCQTPTRQAKPTVIAASWSPTKVVVSCVLPHQALALWDEPTATMETGVLQLQVWSCGTTFQLNCDKLTLAFN